MCNKVKFDAQNSRPKAISLIYKAIGYSCENTPMNSGKHV